MSAGRRRSAGYSRAAPSRDQSGPSPRIRRAEPAASSSPPAPAPLPAASSPLTESTRSEEHTSELQSLMRISYAVFCLKKKKTTKHRTNKLNQSTMIPIRNEHKYTKHK